MTVIPIIVGTPEKGRGELEIRGRIEIVQTTERLRSVKVLWRVLED